MVKNIIKRHRALEQRTIPKIDVVNKTLKVVEDDVKKEVTTSGVKNKNRKKNK
jgi:hypothetical protein